MLLGIDDGERGHVDDAPHGGCGREDVRRPRGAQQDRPDGDAGPAHGLEEVEGDDVLFVVLLKQTTKAATFKMHQRPIDPSIAIEQLKLLGVLPKEFQINFTNRFRTGFYVVPSERMKKEFPGYSDAWVAQAFNQPACAYVAAVSYMFYCYLVCQRIERLLLDTNVNGDWDDELRKILLARKKLLVTKKYALLKNRANPGTELLNQFLAVLPIFRLQEQLDYFSLQIDEVSKALETQSNYLVSTRIRSIEVIIFVSTVLSLAVAINAIQMAPLYDANTTNAFERPILWIVTCSVIGVGIALWATLNNWRRVKLFIHGIFQKWKR